MRTAKLSEFPLHGPIHPTHGQIIEHGFDLAHLHTGKKMQGRSAKALCLQQIPHQVKTFVLVEGGGKKTVSCSAAIQAAIKEYVKHNAVPREIRTFISQTPVLEFQRLKDADQENNPQ